LNYLEIKKARAASMGEDADIEKTIRGPIGCKCRRATASCTCPFNICISPMAWSPLDVGRLLKEEDEQARRVRRALGEIGRELGGATVE
jgi:hypothetical protein